MKQFLFVLMAAVSLSGAAVVAAEIPAGMKSSFADDKPSITYARVKEMMPGQKIVLDVDNSPDKTFDLTDKNVATKLGKGLKVGDPVQVSEWSEMGKTKRVSIVKHANPNVKHGDKNTASQEKAASGK